jgi:hypothetical protein
MGAKGHGFRVEVHRANRCIGFRGFAALSKPIKIRWFAWRP